MITTRSLEMSLIDFKLNTPDQKMVQVVGE